MTLVDFLLKYPIQHVLHVLTHLIVPLFAISTLCAAQDPTSEILFDVPTGPWKAGGRMKHLKGGQCKKLMETGKEKEENQEPRSEMKEVTSLATQKRFLVTCGLRLLCGLLKGRK